MEEPTSEYEQIEDEDMPVINSVSSKSNVTKTKSKKTVLLIKEEVQRLVLDRSPRLTYHAKQGTRVKSEVWNYFNIIAVDGHMQEFVKCCNCESILAWSLRKGTTSLTRHQCGGGIGRTEGTRAARVTDDLVNSSISSRGRAVNTPVEEDSESIVLEKMSLRSVKRLDHKPKSSEQALGGNEVKLEEKVVRLEEMLKKFRSEINMKMSIVEQVLTTRNEMFTVHKKLIEREQALHTSVLSHWKNIPQLVATGLSLKFTEGLDEDDIDVEMTYIDEHDNHSSILGKRQGSPATMARRSRRKRLKAKLRRASDLDSDIDEIVVQDPLAKEGESNSETIDNNDDHDNDDDDPRNPDNMERKVFVNYYSEEAVRAGQYMTNTPVWKHFLREENGNSVLCKLCDEIGVQCILTLRRGNGTSPLHNHIKCRHPNEALALGLVVKQSDVDKDGVEKDSGGPILTKQDVIQLIATDDPQISYVSKDHQSKHRSSSKAWDFFRLVYVNDVPVDFVVCKNCETVYKYKVAEGTSTLLAHAKACETDTAISKAKLKKQVKSDDEGGYE